MADRYLRASGNWNGPVWAATSSGAAGSAATPTASDFVYIQANFTVTLPGNAEAITVYQTAGHINLSSYNLTLDSGFQSVGSTARSINLGSGVLETNANKQSANGSGFAIKGSNCTLTAGTSTVILNCGYMYATESLETLSQPLNDVIINLGVGTSSNPVAIDIIGSPTFRSLVIQSKNSAAHTVNMPSQIRVNKFVAIGSSSSNRLTFYADPDIEGTIRFTSNNSTSYGQYVRMSDVYASVDSGVTFDKAYIGSNSSENIGGPIEWLIQDPPKASTLIDEFSTGSVPDSKWITETAGSGNVLVSSGKLNLSWTSGFGSNVAVSTNDTYDLVDSSVYVKVDSLYGGELYLRLYPIGQPEYISTQISPTTSSVYYRLRGVKSGSNVTIYAERGGISGWTVVSTNTYEESLARSVRFSISGSRTTQSMSAVIDSVGVSPEPAADFTADVTSGNNPLAVQFTDGSNFSPTNWSWNFGDSTTSTAQNPLKTYALPGTYTVTLTASKTGTSRTVTKTNYITVTPKVITGTISGQLKLTGGNVTQKAYALGSAGGSIMLTGSVRGVVIQDASRIEKKTYLYKVYDPDGNYIETWQDVIDEPEFTEEINSLGSSMTIELARNSDSVGQIVSPLQTEDGQNITAEDGAVLYATTESRNQVGSGSSVDYNNRVDIYVFYGYTEPLMTESGEIIYTESGEPLIVAMGAPNGRRIFTGFISGLNSRYGDTETTVVQLSSYGWDLGQFPIMSGANTTVSYSSEDPSFIAKDLTDKFVSQSSGYGTYTKREEGSISNTGTTVSYTFRANTYAEGLSKTVELMPSNWYYRVGLGDNTVYFRERASTPQHLFLLGKHIKSLELAGSILDSVNDVLFTGGGDPALYIRRSEAPALRTRRRLVNLSDNRVTVLESAEIIAENQIGNANKQLYRTTVTILSEVYDIESINIGDVVGFRNFDNYVDGLTMQIVGRSYTPDAVTLQLESMPLSVNKRLEDLRRNLSVTENENAPNSPS